MRYLIRKKAIEARKKVKMSRKRLARILAVCPSTIEKVEKGQRNPSVELAKKWSEALKLEDTWEVFFDNESDNMSNNNSTYCPTGT